MATAEDWAAGGCVAARARRIGGGAEEVLDPFFCAIACADDVNVVV